MSDRRPPRDAIVRAEAFMSDRARDAFQAMAYHTDTYAIEPGSAYRTCVRDRSGVRTYCVIVRVHLPLAQSVAFDGYEPNAVFASGSN